MLSPQQMINKWYGRFVHGGPNTSLLVTSKLDVMYSAVQAEFPRVVAIMLQVKQVLDGLGVNTIMYPYYLAFAMKLFALQNREISGESAAMEATVFENFYAGLGLDNAVLDKIRSQVFSTMLPTP